MTKTIPQLGKAKNSEKLTIDEIVQLTELRNNFITEQSCADYLSVNRSTLGRVLLVGSGKPDTIQKIRKKLKKHALA